MESGQARNSLTGIALVASKGSCEASILQPSRRYPMQWRTMAVLFLATLAAVTTAAEERKVQIGNLPPTVALYPDGTKELWGYQELLVVYDHSANIRVKDIKIDTGQGPKSVLTESTSLRVDDSYDAVTWCVQCSKSRSATVTVELEGAPTIQRTYRLHESPIVNIETNVSDGGSVVTLDASSSRSPQGQRLKFAWHFGADSILGPLYKTSPELLAKRGIFLTVSDDALDVDEIATQEFNDDGSPKTGRNGFPVMSLADDHLKCTDLQIVNKGTDLLNPDIELGAQPPLSQPQTWPVDSKGNLKVAYGVQHNFDVVATVVVDNEAVLHEGQGVAWTEKYGTEVKNKEGQVRKTGAKAFPLEPGRIQAAYPDPFPKAPDVAKTVDDNYFAHPAHGSPRVNTPNGPVIKPGMAKNLDSTKTKLIWSDTPTYALPKNSVGKHVEAGYKHWYFHAWMSPDLKACEKYFTIKIDWNDGGEITNNSLEVLTLPAGESWK